jgi:RNA polymerase sigma-70 factor (ECF subfamily)
LYDYYRRAGRADFTGLESLVDLASPEASPDNGLLAGEERLALKKALGTLKKRELTAVSLKYAGGLRNNEVAAVLGISEKNAGVILSRALKKLRTIMERKMKQ